MNQRIAILRGINVGGKRKILMADLKSMFEDLGFANVSTYIQSGNVLFDCNESVDHTELSKQIEEAITKNFGWDVPVIIRTPEEIYDAINQNVYYRKDSDSKHLHLTFLSEIPSQENLDRMHTYQVDPDRFYVKGKEVFVYCAGKYHQSKLTNQFFESKLQVKATTRNWKTVLKLIELSQRKDEA